MSLKEMRRALDSKQISACELTKEYINKIKNIDKKINS